MTDIRDRFNPATYMVIDKITGEEIDVAVFVEKASKNGWQKAYAKTLASYINIAGDKASAVLSYLIQEKDASNLVHGTQAEIANNAGASIAVTKRVMKKLIDKEMIKIVRSGCYMLTPKMIRIGNNYQGAMLLRLWDNI